MSEMKMPAAVQRMIDAINDGDSDAFVAAFTADGTIDDWGRVLSGAQGLRQWARTDAIGANATMTVITAVIARFDDACAIRVEQRSVQRRIVGCF